MQRQGSFFRDVLKIMGGTAFGQALGILTLPIITRLFSPEAFGEFGVFVSILGILSVIVCMRYELAIVLPKEDVNAASLYWTSMLFTLFWTIATSVVIFFFSPQIAQIFNAPHLSAFLWLVPVGVFMHGVNTSQGFWNTRKAQFGRLAGSQIGGSVVQNGGKLIFGFAGFTSGVALIIASQAGMMASTLILGRKVWRADWRILLSGLRKQHIIDQIKKYKNIAVFNSTSSLFNSLSQQAPIILLAYFFSPAIVGSYVLGHKLLKIPVNILGTSMRKVFFQRASKAWNETGDISSITLNTATWLSVLSLFALTMVVVLLAPLTPLIFGEDWIMASSYMQWIAVSVIFTFICNPIAGASLILQKEHILWVLQMLDMIIRFGALIIGGYIFDDPLISIILYSIAAATYQLVLLIWVFFISNSSLLTLAKRIPQLIFVSLCLILLSVFFMHKNSIELRIIATSVYVIVYAIMTKQYWTQIIKGLKP